jgi:two-component system chemotaxis sensor kinase CheA
MNTQHAALLVRLKALADEAPLLPHEASVALAPIARAASAGQPGASGPEDASRTLRVHVDSLDRLLDLTGEIAVARGRLRLALESGAAGLEAALEIDREADRLHADLQELVMKARMVPIGPTFRRFGRQVRDIASSLGKRAVLSIEGEDVEVDNKVVEQIKDPLTHLVRNALGHGIESPEARRASGKPPEGRIELSARHEAGQLVIVIQDDGAGLDRARILAKAHAAGLAPEQATLLTEADLLDVIFTPAFSTAESVTELSGRGVGLDVVRRNVEALRGTVSVASERGSFTRFTIRLPLTLAIIPGFVVTAGEETFVIPLESVVECAELPETSGAKGERTGVLELRGEPLPFLRLRQAFEIAAAPPAYQHVIVVQRQQQRLGIAVDELLGECQVVLKPLGRLFKGLPGIGGSTILGNGRVALVLDVATLFQQATRGRGVRRAEPAR